MFGAASHSPALAKGQYELRTHPLDALVTAEQILNGDPHSLAAHRLLADAALASTFPRTAVLSLEIVFKNAPDRDAALKLGRGSGPGRPGPARRIDSQRPGPGPFPTM